MAISNKEKNRKWFVISLFSILFLGSILTASPLQNVYALDVIPPTGTVVIDKNVSFSDTINLSNNSGSSSEQSIASAGNSVYVVWRDNSFGVFDVFLKISNDNGASFGQAKNLSNSGVGVFSPRIAVSGNNVYVIWPESVGGNSEILIRTSNDGGITFGPVVNISNTSGSSSFSDLIASGSDVYVMWSDNTPGNNEIFFSASNDAGSTFSTAINLSNNAGSSDSGDIAFSGNNVYVAWSDISLGNREIFLRISNDSGASFGTIINVSNGGTNFFPQLAASGTDVFIVWNDLSGTRDIVFRVSRDNGNTFDFKTNISNTSGDSRDSRVLVSGNNVFVVWREDVLSNNEIFLRASIDKGNSFEPLLNLSETLGRSILPTIAVSGNILFVIWEDDTLGNDEIFFRTYQNLEIISGTANLSNTVSNSVVPQMIVSGNDIFVAWKDRISGSDEVLFTSSNDGGITFGSSINLSNNAGNSGIPVIALSGNNVYVAWADSTTSSSGFDIFIRVSNDRGATFGSTINLTNVGGSGSAAFPKLDAFGNDVYVVWTENTPGNNEIFFSASNDAGSTFSTAINLSNNAGNSFLEDIAISGSNVYVSWEDLTTGNGDTFFRASNNGGATFGPIINLSNLPGTSFFSQIKTSGSDVFVVWSDGSSGFQIFLRISNDNGVSFGPIINLSNNAGGSFAPDMFLAGNNIFIVWRDVTPGNNEIFYKTSNDGGATFGATINLSANAGRSGDVKIDVTANKVFVVWRDDDPGNREILMRESNDFGISFGSTKNLSSNVGDSFRPSVASSFLGQNLYVVWDDKTPGSSEIFFQHRITKEPILGKTTNLSNSAGNTGISGIVSSGNNVLVTWSDDTGGNFETLLSATSIPTTIFSNSPTISLILSCSDLGSGCSQMQIALDGITDTEPFEPFSNTKIITLGPGEGIKNIAVRFADGDGNISSQFVNSVTLDITPPTVSNVLPTSVDAGVPTTYSSSYTDNFLVQRCSFIADAINNGPMTLSTLGGASGTSSISFVFNTVGNHDVQVICEDAAGNGGTSLLTSVTVLNPDSDGDGVLDGVETALTGAPDGLDVIASGDTDSINAFIEPSTNEIILEGFDVLNNLLMRIILPQGSSVPTGALDIDSGTTGTNIQVDVTGLVIPYPPGKSVQIKSNSGSQSACIVDKPQSVDLANLPSCGQTNLSISQVKLLCDGVTRNFSPFPDAPFSRDYTCNKVTEMSENFIKVDGLAYSFVWAGTNPEIDPIVAPIDPVTIGTEIIATANFVDVDTEDTHTAIWEWGDSTSTASTVTETGGSGSVSDTHIYDTPGTYTIKLTVSDQDGRTDTQTFQFVVVYDPAGGFVTGGGWITSPEGAFIADDTLTGKANFGFVSKYKKGATVPTGNTQFVFKTADLNFHSDEFEWLVVAGSNAKFKGTGTINGEGNYGFLVTAFDADVNTNDSQEDDKFRIKIWDKDNPDALVYDNEVGAEEDAEPTTIIGGGSIVVHGK